MEDSEKSRNFTTGFHRIMDRCLEKNPEDRFQSARDLTFALEAISGSTDAPVLETASKSSSVSQLRKLTALFASVACALFATSLILGIAYFRIRTQQASPHSIRFEIPQNENATFSTRTSPTVSPNGRLIYFQAISLLGSPQFYVREVNSFTFKSLPGTMGALDGFWSADSKSIAFFARGKLKRIDVQSGDIQDICDASTGRGGTWNRENIILFASAGNSVLLRVPASGGTPEPVTELSEQHEFSHRYPQFLPDGKHFLFLSLFSASANSKSGIYIGTLDSKEKKFLFTTKTNAYFAPPGSLFFVRNSALMVQPFDPQTLKLSGEAKQIAPDVGFVGPTGQSTFSISENGILTYRSREREQSLSIVNREGNIINSVGPPGEFEDPALSLDAKMLAVTRDDVDNSQSIWVYDFNRNTFSRLTFGFSDDPIWSNDGKRSPTPKKATFT